MSRKQGSEHNSLSLMVHLSASVSGTRRFTSFLWVMGRPRVHIILLKVFYSSCGPFLSEQIIFISSSCHENLWCNFSIFVGSTLMWENIWFDHDDCHHPFTLGWEWAHGAIACVCSPHAPWISSHLDYYAMINKVRTSAEPKKSTTFIWRFIAQILRHMKAIMAC